MKQKGFTLIELMIVVGIIGVLTLIAYPSYQNYMIKVKITEAVSVGSSLARDIFENMASGDPQDTYAKKVLGLPNCDFIIGKEVLRAKSTKDIGIPHAKACYWWSDLAVVLNKDEFPFKTEKAIFFQIRPRIADVKGYTWSDMFTCGQKGHPFGKKINLPRKHLPLGCRYNAVIGKDGALDWPEDF